MVYLVNAALFLLILLFSPSVLAASTAPLAPGSRVAVLPVGGDADAPDKLKQQTLDALERTLTSMQYRVITPDLVSNELTRLGRDPCRLLRTCDQPAVLEALKADAVASVALWLAEDGKTPQQVVVRVTRNSGWGVGEVAVGDTGLVDAAGAALALALSDSEKRHQVTLRVEAEPTGARVEVDHQRVGVAPAEIAVLSGRRMITVSAKGYITESSYVDVPAEGSQPFVYRISLSGDIKHSSDTLSAAQTPVAGLSDQIFESKSSPWNYVLGGALVAASAPLILFPVGTAVRGGECANAGAALDHVRQCQRYHFGTQSGLLLVGGLVALGGGVAILLIRPIRTRESVAVEARLNGLLVKGGF